MKYYFLIGVIILLACKSNLKFKKNGNENIGDKIYEYPQQIKDLHVNDLYDSAKWYIYTWNCDVPYKSKNNNSKARTFSELALRFDNLVNKHDTLILIFSFMDGEQPILPSLVNGNKAFVTGIGFNTNTKNRIYMVSSNIDIKYKGDPHSRYEDPLQPEVIDFLKNNKDNLNSWFSEEAKRRKIIE